jgi:hypothetical protein
VEVQPTVLDGGERLTSHPGCFTPGKTGLGNVTWIKKLGGPQSLCGRSKVNLVRGREGPQGCQTSRLPHIIGRSQVVSLTRRPASVYPQEVYAYSFLLEAESTPGPQCGWKD